MGHRLAALDRMDQIRPQLGRLVALPLATIGLFAAVLTWEIEHVGSMMLALALAGGGVFLGVAVARRVRAQIDELSACYGRLLHLADDQSRQAESANRVKDQFLATLSHELRTPLNALLGWARLLSSGKLDAEQHVKAVQAIERAGWAQSRLIEDLLDMSRIISGKLEIESRPALIQPLVEAAVQSQRPAALAKGLTLEVDLDPTIGLIAVDPDRVQQIVWNLVSNAIKFTPSGGRVDVRLCAVGQEMCLSVDDTGIGFDPAIAGRLFERFRQADSSSTRPYGGLGLGLGIVRHLVELHGGTVKASSAGTSCGAVFEVRMPLRPVSAYVAERQAAAESPSLRGVTVLVVDEDPEQLAFVRITLEHYGAFVMTASSTREARDRFTRDTPDVLVSDMIITGEDELALIKEIRSLDEAHGGETPAAALTSLARREDRRRALSAGYQMHVAKPMDPHELAFTVEQLARSATRKSHSRPAH